VIDRTFLVPRKLEAGTKEQESPYSHPTPDTRHPTPWRRSMDSFTIGMLLFPRLTQLDLTGPHEVFARLPGARVLLLAETAEPVRSESGLLFQPDLPFDQAPPLDVLFVPGGAGIGDAMLSLRTLEFLRAQAGRARYVTAVCTGSLLLGASGALRGYRATTHWLSLDLLPLVGAIPVRERVVVDRNRITGGGVTAGIDFALRLAAELCGEDKAQEIQLLLEYDPAPPFSAGSPRSAPPELVERLTQQRRPLQERRRRTLEETMRA
jgi:cyclohexyl-isocyanide hydratase